MTSSKNYHTVDRNEPLSEWELASFFEKWSFQVVNPMLKRGLEETLEFDQLLRIPCKDRSSRMVDALKIAYASSEPFWFMPRLMVALIKFSAPQVAFVAVFTTLDAALMVTLPLLLQYLLEALQRSAPLNDCFMWAGFLSGVAFTQVFVRHSLYFVAMRTGWNWKNASTALIHDKLILMDSTALQRSNASSGMMVNLISNDVARFEEFSTVCLRFSIMCHRLNNLTITLTV